jgi:hypothetical protein
LLEVIGPKQIRSRQRRFIDARPRDETIAQARVGTRYGVGAYANVRVVGTDALKQVLARNEALERSAQVGNRVFVDCAHLG